MRVQVDEAGAHERRFRVFIGVGWACVASFVALAAMLVDYRVQVRLFQAGWLVGFVGFALVVRGVWRLPAERIPGRWAWWMLGFVLLRVTLLHTAPSDDLRRYVWEGEIQRHGFNPYAVAPRDERLADLRVGNEHWARINHPDYPAIYPPLAQLLFRALAGLSHSVYAIKAIFVGLDVLCVALLGCLSARLGVPRQRVCVYALCPLTLTAFGIDGRLDTFMLCWLVAGGIFAARGRLGLCGVALGLAIASKLVCVVLLPWLAMRKPGAALLAVAVTTAAYLPFADAGTDVFASLIRFGQTTSTLSLVVSPLEWLGWGSAARILGGVLLVVVAGIGAFRRAGYVTCAARMLAGLLLVMPVVHYWYLTWFLVFGWVRVRAAWLVLAAAMGLSFEAERMRAVEGAWRMPTWVWFGVYVPFIVTWAVERAEEEKD